MKNKTISGIILTLLLASIIVDLFSIAPAKLEANGTQVLPATIHIDPDAFNLSMREPFIYNPIIVHIELPESYNVSDIDVSTILLNDTIPAELKPTVVGDFDNDTGTDLVVEFDTELVISYVYDVQGIKYGNVTSTISGKLDDGTRFEGSDTKKVDFRGDVNNDGEVRIIDGGLITRALGTNASCPYGTDWGQWNPNADLNQDGIVDSLDLEIYGFNYGKCIPYFYPSWYELKKEHNGLLKNYTELSEENNQLQSDYNDLESKLEALTADLGTTKNLSYIFIITTIIFIATTVYLAARKPKVKPELRTT